MANWSIEAIGIFAGILGIIAWIPQLKKIWIENGGPEKAARLKAEQEGASGTAGEEEQNEESDVDDEGR